MPGFFLNVQWLLWCAGCALLMAGPARADIYGFIDEQGVIRFAETRIDARYTLFFKDGDGGDSARLPGLRGPAGAPTVQVHPVAPPPDLDAIPLPDLQRSRFLERILDHPNIRKYQTMIREIAFEQGIDPHLMQSVIAVESAYQPDAVSAKGAVGLMQVMPGTGERYGLRGDAQRSLEQKLADPMINLRIGARYLADLRKMFADDLDLMLAAYNAGENTVRRYRNAIPPYPETQMYVKLVREFYRAFKPPPPAPDVVRVSLPAPAPERVPMSLRARRNMPEPGRFLSAEVLHIPALPTPDVLQVPALAEAHDGGAGATTLSPGLQ